MASRRGTRRHGAGLASIPEVAEVRFDDSLGCCATREVTSELGSISTTESYRWLLSTFRVLKVSMLPRYVPSLELWSFEVAREIFSLASTASTILICSLGCNPQNVCIFIVISLDLAELRHPRCRSRKYCLSGLSDLRASSLASSLGSSYRTYCPSSRRLDSVCISENRWLAGDVHYCWCFCFCYAMLSPRNVRSMA